MKIIVAGSRSVKDYNFVAECIQAGLDHLKIKATEIVSGGANGVDKLGEEWAKNNGVNCVVFPAKWNDIDAPDAYVKKRTNPYNKKIELYNAHAGFARNQQMAEYADALIAININNTPGTRDMTQRAKKSGKLVYEWGMTDLTDEEFEQEF